MARVPRLYEQIQPVRYRYHLTPDADWTSFSVVGEIEFELRKSGQVLRFHGLGLSVQEAALEGGLQAASVEYDKAAHTVSFTFENEVEEGLHTLSLRYRGEVRDGLHGLYRSTFCHEGQEKKLLVTQFEAVHAREAIICVDEPEAKAVFEISMTVPEGMRAISNTGIISESTDQTSLHVKFAPTPKMSSYLLAFVIGELEYASATSRGGVEVRVYTTPGKSGQAPFALDVAARTLDFFGDYFDLPYPLPKLDMIAIPDFASGAMENWGAVTYRETALLIDPEHSALANRQRVAEVVAHELAHQWFGNLVTMKWWDDLWLNEGFATWAASLAMDHLFPEWDVWTQFLSDEYAPALSLNALSTAPALKVDIDDPRELDAVFDPGVVYAKGASVIRMLTSYLGADTFRNGMRRYLADHAYSNTVTADLWRAHEAVSDLPVSNVMNAWTATPGYPLVALAAGELIQSRFYLSPAEREQAAGNELWPIPLRALTDDGKETPPALLSNREQLLPEEWKELRVLKLNPGQAGLYRSLYGPEELEKILPRLAPGEGQLGPADRFGIIDDAVALTVAGLQPGTALLQLLAALRDESHLIVWDAVTAGLGGLLDIIENGAARERFGRFGLWLTRPNAERLGWEPKEGESYFDALMRPGVLAQAARFGDEDVIAEARRLFKVSGSSPIAPDLRGAVYTIVARYGGESEYAALRERYMKEEQAQEKSRLLGALTRFRRPNLIARTLEFGLSPQVRSQDFMTVLGGILTNRAGRDQGWDLVRERWDLLEARFGQGGHMLEYIPRLVGSAYASEEKAREIERFFAAHPHPAVVRPARQAVEAVRLKAAWARRDAARVDAWVRDHEANRG